MISRIILGLSMLLVAVTSTAFAGKNAIYKGVYSSTDLVTGKVDTVSLYLIFGEETPLDVAEDRYNLIAAKIVALNGVLGPRRYLQTSFGPRFRTSEQSITVGTKTTITEIFTQCFESQPTDTGAGSHSFRGLVLVGKLTNPKYDFPLTLKGSALSASGQFLPNGQPPLANAARGKLTFKLVSSLTDPIPSGESLDDSVKRVTDYLTARGYIEFVP